jgi:EAL domain-containing protein (putative c-di-GMP-specific phosphodiesterase class I)
MDDFGTGYSSLSYLKRFPVDKLKIDRSFIQDLIGDPSDAALCETIISMGSHLSLKVIAEGVETEEQWNFLLDHGCDSAQGFLRGKPMPLAELEQFICNLKMNEN